jgi:hypothetical protein
MPLNKPRFRNEVTDIADQLAHLGEHRQRLLEADSIRVLDSALEAMEHSVDILKACVSGLKYRVGLQVSAPENLGHLVGSGKDVIGTSLKPREPETCEDILAHVSVIHSPLEQ